VIDSPDAARQPLGRVHSHSGIENDAFRHDGAMNEALLEFEAGVGDAGASVELSGRECRWHSDLADLGCTEVWDLSLAVCDDGAEGLHPIDICHAMLEADGDVTRFICVNTIVPDCMLCLVPCFPGGCILVE